MICFVLGFYKLDWLLLVELLRKMLGNDRNYTAVINQ